ncbi:MAG: peptidoglycan-binding protein [Alphaproteobacteria bacterium]|nr:peptidoglycan-binding protein [Alphaproteobacteria bacterium]
MNRLALLTGILSLTLVGVAAQAQAQSSQTQSGSQPKFYQNQTQAGAGETLPPGGAYTATQQRSQTQPGSQPKFYQHQNQPSALSTEPAPASGPGVVGAIVTGKGASTAPQPHASQAQPYASQAPTAPVFGTGDLTTDVQSELAMAGFDPGPIDGIKGPRTTKAIRAYQAASGMPQDGEASPSLLHDLRSKRLSAHNTGAGGTQPQPQAQPQAQAQPASPYASTSAATVTNGSGASTTAPPSNSAQKSAGFFSGWFQRMDDESSAQNRQVQPGYQPKFYRERTTSQESHGPGITYPYTHPPVAQQPGAQAGGSDAAALNQVSPAAGTPGGGAAEMNSSAINPQTPYERNNNGGN